MRLPPSKCLDVEQLGAVFDVADDTARDRVTHAGDAVDAAPPVLPWTLITDVPSDSTPLLFTEESFCSIQCETALAAGGADGSDVSGFLDAAVAFCNDKLWGSLNACIVIDPVVEIAHKARLESAIAQLRYGTVAVNVFPGIGYGLGTATWGAFPGEFDLCLPSPPFGSLLSQSSHHHFDLLVTSPRSRDLPHNWPSLRR